MSISIRRWGWISLAGLLLWSMPSITRALDTQNILQAHNTFRAAHQARALAWSASLLQAAQKWANTCPSGHDPNLKNLNHGENIRWSSAPESEANIVASWYNERPNYERFSNNYTVNYPMTEYQFKLDNAQNSPNKYGHFTQVVWGSTTQLGCAQATCNTGWRYVTVCRYAPAGNYIGQFLPNVKAPRQPIIGVKLLPLPPSRTSQGPQPRVHRAPPAPD